PVAAPALLHQRVPARHRGLARVAGAFGRGARDRTSAYVEPERFLIAGHGLDDRDDPALRIRLATQVLDRLDPRKAPLDVERGDVVGEVLPRELGVVARERFEPEEQ